MAQLCTPRELPVKNGSKMGWPQTFTEVDSSYCTYTCKFYENPICGGPPSFWGVSLAGKNKKRINKKGAKVSTVFLAVLFCFFLGRRRRRRVMVQFPLVELELVWLFLNVVFVANCGSFWFLFPPSYHDGSVEK